MTLPAGLDPFGFWQAAPAGLPVSFGAPDSPEDSGAPEPAAVVWSLDLSGADEGAAALAARAGQVAAVEQGLALAGARLEAFLAARAAGSIPAPQSFSGTQDDAPERFLAAALDGLETPSGQASYGPGQDLAALAGRVRGLDQVQWGELRARLAALLEGIHRQLLHFVWVDTTLDGRLGARTSIAWSGDLSTWYWSGLSAAQLEAHRRSLALSTAARAAHLAALLAISQMAAKIALAVSTPLGPLQALALAWQFVHSIVLPLLPAPPNSPQPVIA